MPLRSGLFGKTNGLGRHAIYLIKTMTPPTFSKPKRKLCPSEIQQRRDYRTIYSTRITGKQPDAITAREPECWEGTKSLKRDWIECEKDAAEVAAILKKKEGPK